MTDDTTIRRRRGGAWQQFLLARRDMLNEYDRARVHAETQAVQTHHGVVGEAAVRDWLSTFLPKRFGVAPGYIRSQNILAPDHQSNHFDVIIYDQLQAPTLWIEANRDRSENGRARIIPAEYVHAVLEVKSAFNRRSVHEAAAKLNELRPFMAGTDVRGERYPKYLPDSAVLAMFFFELRRADSSQVDALDEFRDLELARTFYGGVVLRGDGLSPNASALIRPTLATGQQDADAAGGLLESLVMSATRESQGHHLGALLHWRDINFSQFAFDLLALLNGTFDPRLASSFHGLDFTDVAETDG